MKSEFIKYRTDAEMMITDMSWERIFLNFTIRSGLEGPVSFSLGRIEMQKNTINYDGDYSGDTNEIPAKLLEEIALCPEEEGEGEYRFRINMSVADGRSFLENGKWYFIASEEGCDERILCCVSNEMAYRLDGMDKIFPYGKNRYSYNASFAAQCIDSVNIIPILMSSFMIENDNWRDLYVTRERKTLYGRYRCVLKKVKIRVLQFLYSFFERTNKKNGKRILLMSETRPYLWGNLKYIHDRLHERGLDKEFEIATSFRIAVGKNNSARSWLRTMRLLAKQDYIFVDDFAPLFGFLDLSPRTKLIQVWHAGEGFKSVGYARFGENGSPRPVGSCHRKYDYAVVGSPRLAEVYSEVFGQPMEHMLPLGMARLDGFLDEDTVKEKTGEFYSQHPELKGRRLILFCPTFRGSNQKQAYYNYDQLDFRQIYDFCGDEYVWAFKMHPFVKKKPPVPGEFSDRIIDLTPSRNINDLYYVTDIMITDYSSAYYEYALLRRPVLFFTYDREVYEITRGVHKSIMETAPGKVCDTFSELMKALKDKDYEIEKTISFSEENFGEYDGRAADRIIDTIILNG